LSQGYAFWAYPWETESSPNALRPECEESSHPFQGAPRLCKYVRGCAQDTHPRLNSLHAFGVLDTRLLRQYDLIHNFDRVRHFKETVRIRTSVRERFSSENGNPRTEVCPRRKEVEYLH